MKSTIQDQQQKFIASQVIMMTLSATLGRNKVYSLESSEKQKLDFRKTLEVELKFLSKGYSVCISEIQHETNIINLANKISKKHADCLKKQRFRIGTAQKALNLFLKYLWCLGEIKEPPHFPIDTIMLSKIPNFSNIRWTKLDSIDEYRKIVEKAKTISGKLTLAEWELQVYTG